MCVYMYICIYIGGHCLTLSHKHTFNRYCLDSMPEVVFNNYHHKVMGVLAKTEWLNKSREYVVSRPGISLIFFFYMKNKI